MLQENIDERVLKVANYYVTEQMATMRSTAKVFGISKSTVCQDLTKRLPKLLLCELNDEVKKKIKNNIEESARRGGEATKRKYIAKS